MDVVLIGTGNVATIIGKLMVNNGHTIIQLVGRKEEVTAKLANELHCSHTILLSNISQNASLYIIAVSDASIGLIANQLPLQNKLIVHTAGSVSINELKNKYPNHYGVLWPMQTLRKEMSKIPTIPFVIDASDEVFYQQLYKFAHSLSATIFRANDEKRLQLHVAAVMASNFSNHLYTLTEEYCIKEEIDFNLLFPLLEETVERLKNNSPKNVQTGPALRKDEVTINSHLALLKAYPEMRHIYEMMSESIKKLY